MISLTLLKLHLTFVMFVIQYMQLFLASQDVHAPISSQQNID